MSVYRTIGPLVFILLLSGQVLQSRKIYIKKNMPVLKQNLKAMKINWVTEVLPVV